MNDFYSLIDYLTDLVGVEPTIEKTSENWYVGELRLTKKRINNKEIAKFILSKNENGMPTSVLSVANQRGYALLQTVDYLYCAPDKFNINPPKVADKIYYQWIEYRYDVPFEDFINEIFEYVHKSTFELIHTATTLKRYLNKNMNNKDRRVLEGLTKKYGKRYILNEVKSSNNRKWDVEEGVDYKKALKNLKKIEDLKNKRENAISNLGNGDYNEEIEILLDNAKKSIFGDYYIDYNFYSNPDLLYALLQSGEFYNPIIYIDFNNRTQKFNLKDNKLASAIYNACIGSGYNNVNVNFNSNLDVVKISANRKYKK